MGMNKYIAATIRVFCLTCALFLSGCIGGPKVFKSLAGCGNPGEAKFIRIPRATTMLTAGRYGVKSVEVAEFESEIHRGCIQKTVEGIVNDRRLEVLVDTHVKNKDTTIYAKVSDDGSKIKKLLIVSYDTQDASLVYIEGNINLDDVTGSDSEDSNTDLLSSFL